MTEPNFFNGAEYKSYRANVPMFPIIDSMNAIRRYIIYWKSYKSEREAIVKEYSIENHGIKGLETRNALLQKLDAEKDIKKNEVLKKVENNKKSFFDDIHEQQVPHGEDLLGENEPDVALFKSDVVDTPEQALMILEKHQNLAFFRLVTNYALKHDWLDDKNNLKNTDFTFHDDTNNAIEYGEAVFSDFESAINNPLGYAALKVESNDAMRELAGNYGYSAEICEKIGWKD